MTESLALGPADAHTRGDAELAHGPTSSADAGHLGATYRQSVSFSSAPPRSRAVDHGSGHRAPHGASGGTARRARRAAVTSRSMADATTSSITIGADPEHVMAVIADFAAYPEWADQVKSVEILDTDGAGRPERVRFQMDAGPIKDSYTLDYTWAPDGRSVSWTLVKGQIQKAQNGSYVLVGGAGGTTVTYSLAVDLNIPMIGMLRRKAEKVIIDTALKGLKRRVEGTQHLTVAYARGMRIVLFTGKGGVGKTTLAAATAAHLARSGRKTLAVSTDPAHSLGDALEADLRHEPVEVEGADGLFAAHVDARALLDGAWGRLREHLATILAGAGVDELVADELTVLPGVEELLALAAVRRAAESGPWDVVVVDCGPTAETLRLLALPEAVAGTSSGCSPRTAGRCAAARPRPGGRAALGPHRRGPRRPGGRARRPARAARLAADRHPARAHPGAGGRRRDPPDADRPGAARTARRRARREPDRAGTARGRRGGGGALAARARDRAGGGARRRGAASDLPVRTVEHAAAEPTGVGALLALAADLWGDDDPTAERARDAAPGRAPDRGQRPVRGLGVRARAAPARRRGGPARPGPGRRRAGGHGGRGAPAGGAARRAAAVHGDPGPAGRRRPAGGVPARPGAVAAVTDGAATGGGRHGAARTPWWRSCARWGCWRWTGWTR